jgi:hypothetical protein
MRNIDSKIVTLLNEGIKYETLKKLSEPQINILYKKIVTEQAKIEDKVRGVQTLTTGIRQANQAAKELDKTMKELGEDDVDTLSPFSGKQTQSPKQVGPSTNDGDDFFQDGMDIDEEAIIDALFGKEKNKKKTKPPITTLGMMEEKVSKNPWSICTSSLGLEGKKREDYTKSEKLKFERCVMDVKKQNESYESKVKQIEESLLSLLNKHIEKSVTKKEILEMLEQQTKEAPVKTPTKTPTKPERKSPYQPKHKPAPKAGDTRTTPVKTPTKTPTKPERKSPYQPKHKPAPKAVLPEFLKFDNINIKFRNE